MLDLLIRRRHPDYPIQLRDMGLAGGRIVRFSSSGKSSTSAVRIPDSGSRVPLPGLIAFPLSPPLLSPPNTPRKPGTAPRGPGFCLFPTIRCSTGCPLEYLPRRAGRR